jgi:hypothetical protein
MPQHIIKANGPPGNSMIEVILNREELKGIMRDSIWNSVVASCEIEGIDVSDVPRPSADTIPESLLSIS